MKKIMQDGKVYNWPLNRKSEIKCDGYRGVYSIIDAATYDGTVYVLLEHNTYGDETALLLAALPNDRLRWLNVEFNDIYYAPLKRFFILAKDIIEETWDSIDIVLADCYDCDEEDIEFWTDEEMDDMEGM